MLVLQQEDHHAFEISLYKNSVIDLNKIKSTTDNSHEFVFIKNQKHEFLMLNESMCKFMGMRHRDIVGREDSAFFPSDVVTGYRADDRKALLLGDVIEIEERIPMHGEERSFLTRKARAFLPDGSPVVVVCVSALNHISGEEAAWRVLFDQAPVPMWVYDRHTLAFLDVNQAAVDHYGYSREQFSSLTALDIRPREDIGAFCAAHIAQDVSTYRASAVWRHVKADGSIINVIPASRSLTYKGRAAKIAMIYDVTQLKRAEASVARLEKYDLLTDLPNRITCQDHLEPCVNQAAAAGERLTVLRLAVERLSAVNECYGRRVGDALIRQVAGLLGDLAPGAFLARMGGDEFVLVVRGGDGPDGAVALGKRVLASVAQISCIASFPIHVRMSAGVAHFPDGGHDAAALLANARSALDKARRHGGGILQVFERTRCTQVKEHFTLEADLARALDRGEFRLFYQPQASASGHITGFEVLLRWVHPARGFVPPHVFIPVAEGSGSIREIGAWVLRQACVEAASWPNPLHIAVNISPAQFSDACLVDLVKTTLRDTGIDPARLELEITESALFNHEIDVGEVITQIKSLGVKVAMDDFGTGCSSLSHLKTYAFDKIKIDRSFVAQVNVDLASSQIVKSVIGLGLGLGIEVTAEGVETEEQLAFLRHEACSSHQGYLIGRPYPIERYARDIGKSCLTPARHAPALASPLSSLAHVPDSHHPASAD